MSSHLKASVQYREEKAPLFRVKVPVNIIAIPFLTGCSVGEHDEFALHVGTAFPVGPSVRLVYHPNNKIQPAVVTIKAGWGKWLAAINSPFTISAEFDPRHPNKPRIMLKSKPRIGDFSFRKAPDSELLWEFGEQTAKQAGIPDKQGLSAQVHGSQKSDANGRPSFTSDSESRSVSPRRQSSAIPAANGLIVDSPSDSAEDHQLSLQSTLGHDVEDKGWAAELRKGWRLSVNSSMPFGKRGLAQVKWCLKLPNQLNQSADPFQRITKGLPVLALDKVSFELSEINRKASLPASTDQNEHAFVPTQRYESQNLGELAKEVRSMNTRNLSIQKAVQDLQGEIHRTGMKKQENVVDMLGREDILLRSQIFDDLQRKQAIVLSPQLEYDTKGKIVLEKRRDTKKVESKNLQKDVKVPKKDQQVEGAKDSSKSRDGNGWPGPDDSGLNDELRRAIMNARSHT